MSYASLVFVPHPQLTLALAPASDPTLAAALQEYHREGLTNYAAISARLKAEHNINMS